MTNIGIRRLRVLNWWIDLLAGEICDVVRQFDGERSQDGQRGCVRLRARPYPHRYVANVPREVQHAGAALVDQRMDPLYPARPRRVHYHCICGIRLAKQSDDACKAAFLMLLPAAL